MAEEMLANFIDFESEAPVASSNDGRPPKLTQAEAAYLLERGPYAARLRAKERLLEIVLAFTLDDEVGTVMNLRQPSEIKDNVVQLENELVEFEATFNWHSVEEFNRSLEKTESKSDIPSSSADRVIVSQDFLKRKETAVCSETDPEVFFPEKGGSTRQAKAVCKESCNMTDECLEHALEKNERFGIWGGTSESERRKLLKTRVSS